MKTKPLEPKALAACIEYARANAEIKLLKSLISNSLSACFEDAIKENPNAKWTSHLEKAYAFEVIEGDHYYEGPSRDYLSPSEQLEVLAECPHCLAAHNAIQDRKKARKRLGAAKRQITMIGRLA